MAEGEVNQYFVRNDKGTVWGPLALATIELLVENGIISGKVQISEDGLNFAFPGRFPHLRDSFPRELWGDVVAPGPTTSTAPPSRHTFEIPPEVSAAPASAAPMAGPGAAPVAGPGAAPMAGPGAAPMAGPGSAAPRPGPGAAPMAGPRAAPAAGPAGAPQAGPAITGRGPPTAGPGVRLHNVTPGARPVQTAGAPKPPPVMAPPARPSVSIPTVGAKPAAPVVPAAPPPAPAPTPAAPPPAAASPTVMPSVDEATAKLVPARGELNSLSPINLYGRIASGDQTGLLTLTLSDRTVQVHFRKGNPEFIDSTHPEDALGTVLVGAKLVTPEQVQQAEASKERFGGELLATLFGLGLLQPATAFAQLTQRATSILFKALCAEAGTFTFEAKELPPQKAMPLGNRWAVLSDTVRRISSPDLKRRLQSALALPIMKSGGLVAATDLRLTPHEVRALTVIDGVRSLAQLVTDIPQDADHLLRVAFLLKELDGVSFAAVRAAPPPEAARPAAPTPPPSAPKPAAPAAAAPGAAKPPPTVAATPAAKPPPAAPAGAPAAAKPPPTVAAKPAAPAAPAKPPPTVAAKPAAPAPAAAPKPPPAVAAKPAASPGSASDEIAALRQTSAAMKEQNHFERLGLKPETNGMEVKLAYFRLAKLYHPDTLPPGAPPELEKLKADVFGFIGDAYRTLSDDKSRKDYLEELKAGGDGKGGEVDVAAILQAEELFRKGGVFLKSRKYPEAVGFFNEAISLNADEPEFYIWRAYARFLAAPEKKAAQPAAAREIQDALKKNERIAVGHYYLGVIAKTCGDTAGALKHFKKCVEIQPDHIDAAREVRMSNQKK